MPASRGPTAGGHKPVIGLLGGMGSGKSSVASELARQGALVINADGLGHEALRQPEIRAQLVKRWGRTVLDPNGEISRPQVAQIAFADEKERKALEALVHPFIGRRIRQEIEAARPDPAVKLIVLDAAIMLETGWSKVCDHMVYVHAPRAVRLRRLANQRGWSAKEVDAREHAQTTLTEKATRADSAIDNADTPEALARQVADLLRQWGI